MANEQQDRELRRARIRKKKRQRLLVIAAAALIVVLVVVLTVSIVRAIRRSGRGEMTQIGPVLPGEDAVVSVLPAVYDYSKPVPAVSAAPDSYFGNCLFVGDARLAGFSLYGVMQDADILASGSASVDKAFSMDFGGGVTLDAKLTGTQYTAVYLSLGLNELGWNYADTFIEYYGALVDAVRAKQPSARIYVQLITPVSSAKDGNPSYINNTRIESYNALIRQMAEEKEIYYLDLSVALCSEDGYLLSSLNTDGMSFNRDGVEAWYEYLKTHYVQKENYSN